LPRETGLNPQNEHIVFISGADVGGVEQLLKKAGFKVARRCADASADIKIKKSEDGLYITC
jgi:hypothetical protein